MKRLFISILALLIIAAFASCGGGIGGTVKGKTFKNEMWVDDNTFRISAAGVPTRTLTNRVQRMESAKRAAILNAQYQILEKFKGAKTHGVAGMSNFETTGVAVSQEVKGIVRGGSVYSVTYDKDQNCEIIYEVKARGLKKMLTSVVK